MRIFLYIQLSFLYPTEIPEEPLKSSFFPDRLDLGDLMDFSIWMLFSASSRPALTLPSLSGTTVTFLPLLP